MLLSSCHVWNRNLLKIKWCRWSNVLLSRSCASSINKWHCTLCDVDNTSSFDSCVLVTFSVRCFHLLLIFSWAKPNEFQPANAVITFGFTLREYTQERNTSLKLALHGYCIKSEWLRRILSSSKRCLVTNTQIVRCKFATLQPWVSLGANWNLKGQVADLAWLTYVHKPFFKFLTQMEATPIQSFKRCDCSQHDALGVNPVHWSVGNVRLRQKRQIFFIARIISHGEGSCSEC